jgi:hypothetical protein
VSPLDEQSLRQRLHTELGSLDISPAPVVAVARRGRAVRARRRLLAGGVAAAAALAVLAAHFAAAPGSPPRGVTLNKPSPSAPNGVFASGTANGKPWQLAVRNINADPGTPWCLPAVMLNGRDGDVLFGATGSATPSFGKPPFSGNPAFLTNIPGFPGVSAVFIQLPPWATKLTATFLNGTWLAVRPVWVSACSQRFHLAGFVYADSRHAVTQLISGTSNEQFFSSSSGRALASSQAGLWTNFDGSRTDLGAGTSGVIGQGTTNGAPWTIKERLGLGGQCYTVVARAINFSGQIYQCLPIAVPPSVAGLGPVPFPDGIGGLSGYAGLVSPRTAKVIVTLSAAPALIVKPVNVAGRVYAAFAVPPGCQVTRMRLFDSAGHLFASTTTVPRDS